MTEKAVFVLAIRAENGLVLAGLADYAGFSCSIAGGGLA